MATNTQINQAILSPEQQELAKAELAQMQRRMGFEDFMSQILLGGVPSKSNAGSTQSVTIPAGQIPGSGETRQSTTPGPGSSVQQTINNTVSNASGIGNLLIPRNASSVPGSTFGDTMSGVGSKFLDFVKDPKNLGTLAGAASGIPGGASVGRLLGGGLGDLLSGPKGEAPSPATVQSSTSLPPPMKVTSVVAPYDRSPGGPTGAQTAGRAYQTALDGMYTLANNQSMMYDAAAHANDLGGAAAAAGNARGSAIGAHANAVANRLVAEARAAGKDLKDPAVGAEISAAVKAAIAAFTSKNPGVQ